MEQQAPAGPPASPQGWAPPPAPAPQGWAPPATGARGGVTGLAKLGALVLFLFGLLFTLIGVLLLVAGAFITTLVADADIEGLSQGQLGDLLGAGIAIAAVIILVIAILEMLVGVFAWRGSGFARVMGILYGLFFGGFTLLGSVGGTRSADVATANGQILTIVIGALYLFIAIVFIVRYRSRA